MSNMDQELVRPTWTLFFEGALYRKYVEYLKHHDLTQMLNNGSRITSKDGTVIQPPILNDETSWCPINKLPPPNEESPPPYPSRCSSSATDSSVLDIKTIQQRTRLFIFMGITFMALTAALVALIIHFLFIETQAQVEESHQINIPGNLTANQTIALLKGNRTIIIGSLDVFSKHIDDEFSKNGTTTPSRVSQPLGTGSFWRIGPSTTTTTLMPRLVLIPAQKDETTDEPYITPSEQPNQELVMIADTVGLIGERETSISCIVQALSFDMMYLRGKDATLNFTKSRSMKTRKSHSRISFNYGFKIMDGSNMTKIELEIIIKNMECGDKDDFVCGFIRDTEKTEKGAKLIINRAPSSNIKLKQPIGYIEYEDVEIEATWKAGYPSALGNLTWFYTDINSTEMTAIEKGDISWQMKTRTDTCTTYVKSILRFVPVMEMNNTILHVLATYPNVQSTDEKVLVIPGDYCGSETGDYYKPYPYTCTKFVRCRPDLIHVYKCPTNMCFNEKLSQCDEVRE